MLNARTLATSLLIAATSTAQAPFHGNGIGQAFFEHTALRIGGTGSATLGSPAAPLGFAVLAISDGIGPTTHPLTGTVGLDLFSPALDLRFFALDATGSASLVVSIPQVPTLALLPPLFAAVAVAEPTQASITHSSRVRWENADGYSPAGALLSARAAHTATALGDGPRSNETRVLVIGGGGGTLLTPQASRSTELYSTLQMTSVAGPTMAQDRALHQAVRLANGDVLVCGGMDSAGNVTATVEVYHPATNTFTAGNPMLHPRAGHAATLLANGKLLVTGGLANYVGAATNLAAVLNSAQNTGEVFDPATGAWTAVPGSMASTRSGHSQTLLSSGRVLICGGISGGIVTPFGFDLPQYTPSCDLYDPTAGAYVAAASMQTGRAFHGASVLASGSVLVTGGSVVNNAFAIVGATDSCERWNGSTWTTVGLLATPVTNHTQLTDANGRALVLGGLTGIFPNLVGTAAAGRHDGVTFTPTRNLGENPADATLQPQPRGAHTATVIADGSILLLGGSDGLTPLTASLLYLP